MIGSSRSYAIGMAHFQLAGGWISLAIVSGAYTLIFLTGLAIFEYANHSGYGPPVPMPAAAVTLLFALQALVLLFFGSLRVAGAIRSDLSSRMMESHRLMPIPAWRAVFGYIFGGASHVIAFALLTLVFAEGLAIPAGVRLEDVFVNQCVLLLFALFLWTIAALATFFYKNAFYIMIAAGFVGLCTGVIFAAYLFLPGLILLTGPLIGHSIFNYSSPSDFHWYYVVSCLAQVIFIALFFAGACRRFRGLYATTFTALQSLFLVVTWVGVTIAAMAAMVHSDEFGTLFRGADQSFQGGQIVASIMVALILSLIPAYTVANEQRNSSLALLVGAGFIVVLTLIITLIPIGFGELTALSIFHLALTALAIFPFLTAAFLYCRWYRKASFGYVFLTLFLATLVIFFLPLALSLVALLAPDPETLIRYISTLSPIGFLSNIWATPDPVNPLVGLAGLWIGPGLAILLAAALRNRKPARRPAAAPPQPLAPPILPAQLMPAPISIDTLPPSPPSPPA